MILNIVQKRIGGCVGEVLFVVFTERKHSVDLGQAGNGIREEALL